MRYGNRHRTNGAPWLWVALALAALALAAGCSGKQGSATAVSIHDLQFDPTPITVPVGSTVTWTNNDQTAHTVTSDRGAPASTPTTPVPEWTSKPLNPGSSFSHKFTTAGRFRYHCQIHPYLVGEVIVK